MLTTLSIAGILVVAYFAAALAQVVRLGLSLPQALLYAPLKLIYGIEDRAIADLRRASAPVIHIVIHRSRLDPALMLALLPDKTLHILDENSARSAWLEPFRALAPTIAFNAKHLFVSRRLVRRLKGGGKLAVYLPDDVEPSPVEFRLYRAIARIASQADAKVVVIDIAGSQLLPFSLAPAGASPRRLLPLLSIHALEPITIAGLVQRAGDKFTTRAHALFDRVAEARMASADRGRTLFLALRDAADRFGANRVIVEDSASQTCSYGDLLASARLFGRRIARLGEPGSAVGLLMTGNRASVIALLAIQSAGRVAAVLDPEASAGDIRAALAAGDIRTVLVPPGLTGSPAATAIEANGGKLLPLEEIEAEAGFMDRLTARLFRRYPLCRRIPHQPAMLLFTAGSEDRPKGVMLSSANVLANVLQVQSRLELGQADRLLTLLPPHHCLGLSGGILLPLLSGIRTQLADVGTLPAEITIRQRPSILLGSDADLKELAQSAGMRDSLSRLRMVFTCGMPLSTATRTLWQEKFGLPVLEGYGLTEAGPVVSLNTLTHSREGSVGRLLPGITMRLDALDGIEGVARLSFSGPNLMLGYVFPDMPGQIQSAGEWHDTGDLVSVDREGFLTLHGRVRRLVPVGESTQVQLDDIETLAARLWPDEEHAALALPADGTNVRLVLVTTRHSGERAALVEQAQTSGLPVEAVPEEIIHVDRLPRLASGKTDYSAIASMLGTLSDSAA